MMLFTCTANIRALTIAALLLLPVSELTPMFADVAPTSRAGWLGLLLTYPPSSASGVKFLFVQQTVPGSPAALAGFAPHDLITTINNRKVAFADETAVLAYFKKIAVGEKVTMLVVRGERQINLSVTMIEAPQRYVPMIERNSESARALSAARKGSKH